MKSTIRTITGAAALALLSTTLGNLQAQVTCVLALSGSVSVQGSSTDDGAVTKYASPTKHSFVTKDILKNLALDENAAGKYNATTFPAGAKLVAIISSRGNDNGDFQVLDKNNNLLVDVTNIISISYGDYGNFIISGKQKDSTGLSNPSRVVSNVLRINYDDSRVTGNAGFKFYMSGIITGTTTDTLSKSATGAYTETKSFKMSPAMGEGVYQSQTFVLTGNMSGAGKGALTLP